MSLPYTNVNVNYDLWVIMLQYYLFINCNKYTTLVGMIGEAVYMWKQGANRNCLYLMLNFLWLSNFSKKLSLHIKSKLLFRSNIFWCTIMIHKAVKKQNKNTAYQIEKVNLLKCLFQLVWTCAPYILKTKFFTRSDTNFKRSSLSCEQYYAHDVTVHFKTCNFTVTVSGDSLPWQIKTNVTLLHITFPFIFCFVGFMLFLHK